MVLVARKLSEKTLLEAAYAGEPGDVVRVQLKNKLYEVRHYNTVVDWFEVLDEDGNIEDEIAAKYMFDLYLIQDTVNSVELGTFVLQLDTDEPEHEEYDLYYINNREDLITNEDEFLDVVAELEDRKVDD